jgi:hypothetical protein
VPAGPAAQPLVGIVVIATTMLANTKQPDNVLVLVMPRKAAPTFEVKIEHDRPSDRELGSLLAFGLLGAAFYKRPDHRVPVDQVPGRTAPQ